jgi:hypothetical protein
VNVAFLLISTAWSPGAPPVSTPIVAPPAVTSSAPITSGPITSGPITGGCPAGGCSTGSCGAVSDSGCGAVDACCGSGPSFFAKLKAKFASCGHHKESCGCEVTPSCGGCAAPAKHCGGCAAPAPIVSSGCSGSCGATATCGGCDDGCGKPSIFAKLKAKFHKSSCDSCAPACGCDTCGTGAPISSAPISSAPIMGAPSALPGTYSSPIPSVPTTTPPTAEPIKKMPSPAPKGTGYVPIAPSTSVTPAAARTTETETSNPFELDRRYEARVGRAADYSKLTGQLFFVHADGGLWVLRYAPIWKEDNNGGSVVLARDRQMTSYREGDLVTVHGEVVSERGSSRLGGPLYRVRSIELNDRPR